MSSQSYSQIELHNVGQSFVSNQHSVKLFVELSFSIEQGQSYGLTGLSGSGKSSLLMLAREELGALNAQSFELLSIIELTG